MLSEEEHALYQDLIRPNDEPMPPTIRNDLDWLVLASEKEPAKHGRWGLVDGIKRIVDSGVVRAQKDEVHGGYFLKLTDKGRRILDHHREIQELLGC